MSMLLLSKFESFESIHLGMYHKHTGETLSFLFYNVPVGKSPLNVAKRLVPFNPAIEI